MPYTRPKLLPVMRACKVVADTIGVPVGISEAPKCSDTDKAYIVITSVSSPRYDGTMADPEADAMDRIQFASVAATAELADATRDKIREALTVDALDQAFTDAGESRRTMRCILDIPRGVQRDDRGLPNAIFNSIDQYMIETTPTA